jgi:diadenylate cyclase
LLALVCIPAEIRRFLEQGGSSRGGTCLAERSPPRLRMPLARPCGLTLFPDKVGALMVFERKTPLDDIIKTARCWTAATPQSAEKPFWNKARSTTER